MWNLGTTLSYTANLYGTIERRTETPLHFVDGMPRRVAYEADQGWDDLFVLKPAAAKTRSGASAFGQTTGRAHSGKERPEKHAEESRVPDAP